MPPLGHAWLAYPAGDVALGTGILWVLEDLRGRAVFGAGGARSKNVAWHITSLVKVRCWSNRTALTGEVHVL